jgi:AcrR family transcriptional regulator
MAISDDLDAALLSILEAATRESLDTLSVEQVATTAGVSRASAYRHFRDQAGLLLQALRLKAHFHGEAFLASIKPNLSLQEQLEHSWLYTAEHVVHDQVFHRLAELQPESTIGRQLMATIYGEKILEGQKVGEIRSDLSVDEIVDWLVSQREFYLTEHMDPENAQMWTGKFLMPILRPQPEWEDKLSARIDLLLDDIQEGLKFVETQAAAGQKNLRRALKSSSEIEQ